MNITVDADYHLRSKWSLVLMAGYNDFKAKTSSVFDNYWINLLANLRYYMPVRNPWSVYLGAGPGYYIPENGDNEFGASTGLGLNYKFNNRFSFELGADYNTLFGTDISFTQSHIGVVFRF